MRRLSWPRSSERAFLIFLTLAGAPGARRASSARLTLTRPATSHNKSGFSVEHEFARPELCPGGDRSHRRASHGIGAVVAGETYGSRVQAFTPTGTSAYTNEAGGCKRAQCARRHDVS